jgi:putative ABC transport system permease protein
MAVSVGQRRFGMLVLGLFAGAALLLAGIGIYGVISYSVSQRAHEIGVRIALGAQARDVYGLVLRSGMGLAILGTAVGLAAAALIARVMSSLLFGVSAYDPVSFVVVPTILLAIALAAGLVPARRATRVDPLVALRDE